MTNQDVVRLLEHADDPAVCLERRLSIGAAAMLSWCWTIEGPDQAAGSDDGCTIVANYDLVLWAVRVPEFQRSLRGGCGVAFGDQLVTGGGAGR